MKSKVCRKCKTEKVLSEFYPHPKRKWDTINHCKPCVIERVGKWNKANSEERAEYLRQYSKDNEESLRGYRRDRDNKKRRNDSLYSIKYRLSHNLRESLKRVDKIKDVSITDLLGISIEGLIKYLNNNPYGFKYRDKGIDLDHIIPTSSAKDEEELKLLYHYTNLQLLPSYYNRHIKRNNKFNKIHLENWLKEQILRKRPKSF